jgi:hypothetical protein
MSVRSTIERKKPMPYVNPYSFHILDPDWGHLTIKISGHPPFPAQMRIHGRSRSLRTACHAKQRRVGELTFWSALRIDPLNVASRLWTLWGDLKAGERTVFRARQQIDLAKAYG